MSTRKCAWLTVATTLAAGILATAMSGVASAETMSARLGTYGKGGQEFFALSLMPQAAADADQKNEVVILIDTSASQAGRYRAEEMAVLNAMLASLSPNDRVQLMAVDMKAVPLSAGFVAPGGPEMQAALAKLAGRTPLGATDLDAGLRTAAKSFTPEGTARTVVYVGDAMSKANIVAGPSLGKLVSDLRNEHVTVSSYVLGQEQNMELMAALANHTGGVVEADANQEGAAAAGGQRLAASTKASVVWPNEQSLSGNVSAAYPELMPPVRTDRDSILIGKLSDGSPVSVEMNGTMNGKSVKWNWQAKQEKPSEDFAFLPKLVEVAASDKGVSLPTAGSVALRQAAYVTMNSAQQLAKLGNEALASGNFVGAEKVALAALARDPANPEATAIRQAARKGMTTGKPQPTTEQDLKLTGLAQPTAPSGLLAEVLAEPPGFLGRVDEERRVLTGRMQAEVDNALATARRMMVTNPDQVENDLKLTLESIERTPELDPEIRAQLRRKVENTIRAARQEKIKHDQAVATAQEHKAAAQELERLNDVLAIQQDKLTQLVNRFTSLMNEQKWQIADEQIVPQVQVVAPGSQIDNSLTYGGRFARVVNENEKIWRLKDDAFLRSLYACEVSLIPFPDEPPIVYMPPDQWADLTKRREKYKAVDLGKQGGAEQRIFTELNKQTNIDVVETPLKDVVQYLTDLHQIPIVLSQKQLEAASVNADTPVTKQLRGVTLRSALRLILKDLELTYVVRDEVLQITTPEDAENQLITKVYPVGDLVVPVSPGMGGMMGGMGGGMMGGGMMGGGMGGGMMGGGMGGMGGGMGGGMMGGGGGGMFAVEDELLLGAKKPAAAAVEAPKSIPAAPKAAKAVKGERIVIKTQGDESPAAAWDRYFSDEESKISGAKDSDEASKKLLASVRETSRVLMSEKKYAETATMIEAAIRHSQVESWMYEALALAIRADSLDKINRGVKLDEAQTEALERALLSAVDFAQDEDQLVLVAAYMAQAGLEKRALAVYQQVAKLNPGRAEAYLQGLALAQRLNDVPAIEWACVGILSQAWNGEQRELAEKAFRIGKATYTQLMADGRKAEAEAFDAAVRKAQERDCIVKITWTGDADIDLVVEEPTGTVVTPSQPKSTSGGVHLGNVTSADSKSTVKGVSETYVCPEGFAGQYRVLIKSIYGKPTSGKVTLDISTHDGSEKQSVIREQIPLSGKETLATFTLDQGRRKEALRENQVASAVNIQNAANRALLAQQLGGVGGTSSAGQSFANSLGNAGGLGFVPGFFMRGAVGYRPVLTTLPTGASMFVQTAVISADRRYVRIAPSPNFSQVTEVNTFNFVSGQGGTQGAGQGGVGGGGGGGFGGGGAGGGGFL